MRIEHIKKIVERSLEVDLSCKRRFAHLVLSRAVYYKLCRELTLDTVTKIGNSVNMHHATVLHSLREPFNFSQTFPEYRKVYEDVKRIRSIYYDED